MLLIAIGANLDGSEGKSPLETCDAALRAVQAALGGHLTRSRWFTAAAWPDPAGPRYINAMLRLDDARTHDASEVLAALHAIEARFGRTRGAPNAPRMLDLDAIDVGGQIRAAPDPVLPHPRAHARGFVLLPLRDLCPGWVHPVSGLAVDALIAGLCAEDTRPL